MTAPTNTATSLGAMGTSVDIETPELVVLSYSLAGIGSRLAAAFIDALLCFVAIIFLSVSGAGSLSGTGERELAWASAIWILATFAVFWGYHVVFEGLADGQTPGKRLFHLRVVQDAGLSVTFRESAIRNLVRIVDVQPLLFPFVGVASMFFSSTAKRLGDYAAGTMVIKEELSREPLAPVAAPRSDSAAQGADASPEHALTLHAVLREDQFALLETFIRRRNALDETTRAALVAKIATRLAPALAELEEEISGRSDAARLVRLYEREQTARARGAAGRGARGAARERHVIVAARAPRWNRFASILTTVKRRGLAALGEAGVREFVAGYRDLAADLARLQTATRGSASAEVFYLSRMVASAHSVIYRQRRAAFIEIVRVFFVAGPQEIRRSWRPIGLAAALLFGPAAIAYTAVVRDPTVASTFIPPAMLDRAEEGVRRARENTGYIPVPEIVRPVMASTIIANNVQVTFVAFASGITAGIITLALLTLNGVSFGGIMGLYVSKGIGSLLVAFVAPHGVFELFAICVGGGGGFLLAAALLLPGRKTRRRALVDNGRRAIRLVASALLLLLAAGTLEGFVSPIPYWPLAAKLAVSATTAVLLVLYVAGGAFVPAMRRLSRRADDEVPTDDQSAPRDLISR